MFARDLERILRLTKIVLRLGEAGDCGAMISLFGSERSGVGSIGEGEALFER
jgi:hypothetical protein